MSERKLTKFAFWRYDQPPYVVGAETNGKRDKEGFVEVPAYGIGARVKPLKVMDADRGRMILTEIKRRDAIRRAACDSAGRVFRRDVISVAPFMKSIFPKGSYEHDD